MPSTEARTLYVLYCLPPRPIFSGLFPLPCLPSLHVLTFSSIIILFLPPLLSSLVWGTQANFNWFRVLAALLHGTLLVGVSQTLRR